MLVLIKIAASGENQCPCTKRGERAAMLVPLKIAASSENQCLHEEREKGCHAGTIKNSSKQ
jgi:hypothetical protein